MVVRAVDASGDAKTLGKEANEFLRAKRTKFAGLSLHPAQTFDHRSGHGGDNPLLLRVADRERDQHEAFARGQFDVGRVVPRLTRPTGLRPEFRAGGSAAPVYSRA